MDEPRDEERVEARAEQLPEEERVGAADPEAQAAAILEESDERVDDPEGTRRESTQTLDDPPSQADLVDPSS